MIPISVVKLDEAAEQLAVEVIRSGRLAQGPMVARLEREFADLVGVDHAVAVNNGTTALVAALEVLDLQPGDEVITSPFTFVATLNAILEAGATARFADIREDDF
ncbi:DegT/DnrJ/EryC1/StrS family aminotransferase, partial [Micromonospora musae]|uniref:DegT/DnrJ/EryC1/StrS family aminotransferase n=1 Tax=Micromonospora musae TaxID=1894970 RepID=UPI0033C1DE98